MPGRTLLWVLILLVLIGSFSVFPGRFSSSSSTQNLTYGELSDKASRGQIATVTISDNGEIRGEFKNPSKGERKYFLTRALDTDMAYVDALSKQIKANNPDAKISIKRTDSSMLMILLYTWLPLILLFLFISWIMRRAQSGQMGFRNNFMKPRVKQGQSSKKITFADVAGVREAKEDLQEIVEFLKNPQKFQILGAHIPKGVLLIGPPGTGKTLLARAVAGEANVPFFSISGSDFVEMFVGVGAGRVRDLFETGAKNAPCIIFIDELDAVGRHRGTGIGNGHDEREQTLNQLLVEMDGFEANKGVIIIGATNRPDVLDPALLRKGRFDRSVIVDAPDINGRHQILLIHAKNTPLAEDVDLLTIARGTSGFTGADLANLVNEAALFASRENADKVFMKHFELAKDRVIMGLEKRSVQISPKEREVIAYHEAGHTIVALYSPDSDPIHKVTIIPRGMSLGSTHQIPEEDRHNVSKEYLESTIAILMGGRVAEEMFVGKISTGAANDIQRATSLARRMVREWGMSELGPIKFGTQGEHPFLGFEMSGAGSDYSQNTADRIDEAVAQIIARGINVAEDLIGKRKDFIKKLVTELLEKETLDANEIKALMAVV